jgi:hypothetical protein
MKLELPVVRVRRLPTPGARLDVVEGADWIGAVVVLVVGLGFTLLGAAGAWRSTAEVGAGPALAGGVLMLVGLAGIWLAVGESLRRERVSIDGASVRFERKSLDGAHSWDEPLSSYLGLEPVDRARRYHLRNQDRPATGRRGPVSEFVVVLRHRDGEARSVELFRAQPSLATLHGMYQVRAAAMAGTRRAAQADACLELAGKYRDALATLAQRLSMPVLVAGADGRRTPIDIAQLDSWLRPAPAVDETADTKNSSGA